MADILMCSNTECPLRHKCWRVLATPNIEQYYMKYEYNNGCKSFWKSEHRPTKQIM